MGDDLSWEMILDIVKDWGSELCLSGVYPEIISDSVNDDKSEILHLTNTQVFSHGG